MAYFGAADKNVYAVDVLNGQQKWKFETGRAVWSSPAVANGVVYIGSDDAYLYALDLQTGTEKWKFKTLYGIVTAPVVVDGSGLRG